MDFSHIPAGRTIIIQPYETICDCHHDEWLTEKFRFEHEANYYKEMYQIQNQNYQRLFRLIEHYNGNPIIMMIRDKDIRRRHRWCTNKEDELMKMDTRIQTSVGQVETREANVRAREIAVLLKEQRQHEREQRFETQLRHSEN